MVLDPVPVAPLLVVAVVVVQFVVTERSQMEQLV